MNIAVGLSGGVDSAVAAKILLNQGHSVCGVTLRLLADNENVQRKTLEEAAQAARLLGIPHKIYDFSTEFKNTIINYFIESYRAGETPNPCYMCNKHIKFGLFLQKALQEGFDAVATGHYARVFQNERGRFLLEQAADEKKDQSYFLALLNQAQLSKIQFPLANITKPQVRANAKSWGLVNADKADSQDICFVPDGDYAAMIESATMRSFPYGNFIDMQNNHIGTHKGLHRYTIGQRRGLALALGKPIYVIEKCAKTNTIRVGPEEYLTVQSCIVRDVNWIIEAPQTEICVLVKTRYRQKPKAARIMPYKNGTVHIVFAVPERAVTIGQAAVFYQQESIHGRRIILGGGIIQSVL